MENIKLALRHLDKIISEQDQRAPICFQDFIKIMSVRPSRVLRNIFQVFHDMMTAYVGEGVDEYPDDPESINFVNYDCSKLFVEGADHPFFADRLFANRLINQVDALKRGAQQNKIYIFDGPPGCGKSTFLNNLLKKFEEYTNTEDGFRYETVWRLVSNDLVEVPCPSHDHPMLQTEVNIYRNIFGKHIDECFLPRVLHNFARVIISSRIKTRSDALLEWIGSSEKYRRFCDDNLQLLKMEIYTGYIPPWLTEEDRKRFTAQRRRKIIAESEFEGIVGFSGRDAIKIFNEFYSTCTKEDSLINMNALYNYFTNVRKDLTRSIPSGFLDALLHMYNYTVLQEVKESLYYFNEEQISKDIQNYMFAVNFETDTTEICKYTGERVEITEDFFRSIENHLLGTKTVQARRLSFRKDVQKEYTSRTLTQEILMEEKPIKKTSLFASLHERYVFNLKEKALDPFMDNKNFRMAIKDYGSDDFKTYDKRIRNDITFLIANLCNKYRYTQQGAKEVCIYVIDNELPKEFAAI